MKSETREHLFKIALIIAKLINYHGAGTIEFILDVDSQKFYFLEVNTRLQVEHPITEETTKLDLVEGMIRVAQGESLIDLGYEKIQQKGHAIECRLCAEDPFNNFFPCTGTILKFHKNQTQFSRFDHSLHPSGSKVSIYYDSLITKIITWALTRSEAIQQMIETLKNLQCLDYVPINIF